MSLPNDIARIQACIDNPLDRSAIGKKKIAGVIGDVPSSYSKSPSLWNGAFRALGLDAVYLPFDVPDSRLQALVAALRKAEHLMGVSVTVPYKTTIMPYLDDLDEQAKQINAVNTVVRTGDGRLVGYNTDGKGFLESIQTPQPGQTRPFVETLKGMDVLLIGAGGAARSVAFSLTEVLHNGSLLISNRTSEAALSLVEQIRELSPDARAIEEGEIAQAATRVGLIINSSTKGQGGIRKTRDGKLTTLEPYSALAPANPALIPESKYRGAEFHRAWLSASLSDIEANNRASWKLALSIPLETGFSDLIYHPEETVFLRHGRLSGHRTLNGKGMLIAQAAHAFFHMICRLYLDKLGLYHSETYRRIFKVMFEIW